MSKYVKCPICELNYILDSEQCCEVCKNKHNLISDDIESIENENQERLEQYNARQQSMKEFYAIRYDKPNR